VSHWETLKLIATLLDYPSENTLSMLKDNTINYYITSEIREFLDGVKDVDLYGLQELYVNTFELTNDVGLYMAHAVYRDENKRSKLMLKLLTLYERYGLKRDKRELPDYIPTVLVFLSTYHEIIPKTTLRELLSLLHRASVIIKSRISTNNPYMHIINALVELTGSLVEQLNYTNHNDIAAQK
jgi:nitrate reductase molybdenum cofactor assembly chaperone